MTDIDLHSEFLRAELFLTIGQPTEAVAILAVLLRAFRVEAAGAADPRPSMRVTLRPAEPIRMRLRARR